MDAKQRQQIRQIVDSLLRRKKIIISSLLFAIIVGMAVYLVFPKSYKASSLLVYQHQKVNPSKMSPDYKTKFIEILTNLSQQITSRTSLEELIIRFNLYPELRKEKGVEQLVHTMREDITILPEKKGDTFTVSYEGSDPRQVKLVTNALASKFIEENLRFREEWTTENLAYIQNELRMAKETLDEKEAIMRDYTMKHYNEMPEQREANMARLNSLQAQYQHLQNSIQGLERTKVLIHEQISMRRDILAQMGQGGSGANDDYLDLVQARKRLASLQARYTGQHPDIVRLKALIKELERSLGSTANVQEMPGTGIQDPQIKQLNLQIKEIEMEIVAMNQEMEQIQQQMEIYQGWIAAAPARGAEWTALTRDYDEYKKHYDDLVSRSLTAESAEYLEKQQKGSQFRIIDPAGFPGKPSNPNFLQFMLISILLGLGLGGGISFLLETLDTSFRDASDLESYLGLPVTCSIPLVYSERERKRIKLKNNLWAAALTVAVLVIASSMMTLWFNDYIVI